MFYGATPIIFSRAKELRENMTEQEKKLWKRLNKNQLGVRFKPQHPASSYILDFYCHELIFAVELAGPIHLGKKSSDLLRTDELKILGIHLIRFSNRDIDEEIEKVVSRIREEIKVRQVNLGLPMP